jgi:hypothetical protein
MKYLFLSLFLILTSCCETEPGYIIRSGEGYWVTKKFVKNEETGCITFIERGKSRVEICGTYSIESFGGKKNKQKKKKK